MSVKNGSTCAALTLRVWGILMARTLVRCLNIPPRQNANEGAALARTCAAAQPPVIAISSGSPAAVAASSVAEKSLRGAGSGVSGRHSTALPSKDGALAAAALAAGAATPRARRYASAAERLRPAIVAAVDLAARAKAAGCARMWQCHASSPTWATPGRWQLDIFARALHTVRFQHRADDAAKLLHAAAFRVAKTP